MGSTYAQAVTELIDDGRNGWSFKPDNIDAVVDALDRVLNTSADEMMAMRSRARESVRALTPEAAALRIVAHLRAVLMLRSQ
jgi:glycosyltransferase involved in cell wall biosynthesis